MSIHNPNCDGGRCLSDKGEVRVLPTGGDSNAILCRVCYSYEMHFRRERNASVLHPVCTPFDLPEWETLKVYPE